VLVLHGLLLRGLLADFSTRVPAPQPIIVRVSLLPARPPPKLAPLPLPRFAQEPQIVAIQPRVSIAQPPPPDAIRATPPTLARVPSEGNPGPARPAEPPPSDYLSRLEAHLNAYKNYPYDARIHREEGIVQLRFSLDRMGHVLSFDVAKSSGSTSLDNEARDMIRRADPFPPVPADFHGDRLDLVVPLVFSLH